jgi:uncharacterized membrane protein
MDPKELVDRIDDAQVIAAIAEAEQRSRGEIRVHVTQEAVGDAQAAAVLVFERLGMTATAERNGVLIFMAPRTQTFAIIGDRGIHERCGKDFWPDIAAAMEQDFRAGRFTEGLVKGVARAGALLAETYPRDPGRSDANELPDTVSRD